VTPRLSLAIEAAHRAGRATLKHFQTGVAVEMKSNDTPVTLADREAELLIREMISSAFPGEMIIGEEFGETGAGDARWTIDPIDGTQSVVSGVPL
jgi:fructose-1,6-bisphosphatase/inositol monophosphatase family enzyme